MVTFGWLAAALFGALPYMLSGVIPHPVSAVFETMSGFTTTGASVLSNLESVPRGILFWRASTHLFGGMGVLVLCVAILPFLGVGGMSWFDSTCHTFATMATGGFSTRSASIAAFDSTYIDVIIIIFMFLAGAGFFQATSILTTTGFCTQDFDTWPNASRILLILLMFIGGCAGSTGGGIKNIRIFILLKQTAREIRRFMRPKAVLQVKLDNAPVDSEVVSNITAFVAMFVLIFAIATFAMTFFVPDLETAFSSVIASLGNIGPGLANVGATKTYADIPSAGKAILTFCMLLGRLELYTVLVVMLPSFWEK
ncbi:MAG: TrkH family potassium uptake protein [Spartobacteria bacterium]|nr:TrkH family potassium uptake protein [Spartobacteria bacterium]